MIVNSVGTEDRFVIGGALFSHRLAEIGVFWLFEESGTELALQGLSERLYHENSTTGKCPNTSEWHMKQSAAEEQVLLKKIAGSFRDGEPGPGGDTWCYAKELRALGQALEARQISSVDLEVESGVYFVRGKATIAKAAQPSFSKLIRHFVLGGDSDSAIKDVGQISLRYTSHEIQQLDDEARAKRRDASKTPDPYSLSQVLRGAGSYLDNRQTELVGITIKDRWITLRYRTTEGRLEQAKQDLEYFFNYWVKMYLRRRNRPKSPSSNDPTLVVTWDGIKKQNPPY